GQDIGEIPECKNPERRKACGKDLLLALKTYFPKTFPLPWSKNHKKVIASLQRVILKHDKKRIGMPRGKGKTSLCKGGSLLALLFGYHQFVVPVGATGPDGQDMIKWFKGELSENPLLLEDFPEVCYPIMLLENESRRCVGQRYKGKKTNITWAVDRIVFPTIEGSLSSSFIVRATSLEGNIRGMTHRMPDGSVARPTLAICDDPQTRESSKSQGPNGQTTKRLEIINEDVQGLAGPEARTAILIPCTVITPGDLADQILNRDLYPAYRGERTKRMYSWPTNKILWEQYRELRENEMRNDLGTDEAREFYRIHMAKCERSLDEAGECDTCEYKEDCMDCGAVIDWPERLDDPENLSAVQATMHAFYEYGPSGFASECQNEPLTDDGRIKRLSAAVCKRKFSGRPRNQVPLECTELTMGVDVQKYSIWYVVAGWKTDFTGYIVDYGVWPRQQRLTFTKQEIANGPLSLPVMYPGMGEKATIQAGLEDFISRVLAIDYERSGDAGLMRLSRILVDAGAWPSVIAAVKHKVGGAIMDLSKGIGIKAGGRPMSEFKKKKGEKFDPFGHWYMPSTKGTKEFPHVAIDVNYYKSEVHKAFLTPDGDPGALTLFGDNEEMHSVFAAHQTAETFVRTHGRGRDLDEWTLKPTSPDNEWLDSMVYAMCAASVLGIKSPGQDEPRSGRIRKKRVSADELMAKSMKRDLNG
ncbi:MAG: phage terminase large subunit family protein, partial [Candidatus Peribacteraceae bacterium]|nr:phage terminase large subunit family protein [Candidatus Peribacteraceae bacterium]